MTKTVRLDMEEIKHLRYVKKLPFKIIGDFFQCSETTIIHAFERNGIPKGKIPSQIKGTRREDTKANRRAQELGYENLMELIIDKRTHLVTWDEIKALTGLGTTTIYRHTPEGVRGIAVMTPARWEHIRKLNENKKAKSEHIWRAYNSELFRKKDLSIAKS